MYVWQHGWDEAQESAFAIGARSISVTELERAMSSFLPIEDRANEDVELSDNTFDEIRDILL
jgi:hypothetical protein